MYSADSPTELGSGTPCDKPVDYWINLERQSSLQVDTVEYLAIEELTEPASGLMIFNEMPQYTT